MWIPNTGRNIRKSSTSKSSSKGGKENENSVFITSKENLLKSDFISNKNDTLKKRNLIGDNEILITPVDKTNNNSENELNFGLSTNTKIDKTTKNSTNVIKYDKLNESSTQLTVSRNDNDAELNSVVETTMPQSTIGHVVITFVDASVVVYQVVGLGRRGNIG